MEAFNTVINGFRYFGTFIDEYNFLGGCIAGKSREQRLEAWLEGEALGGGRKGEGRKEKCKQDS